MDRWKAEQGRGREKRKIRREKSRRERVRRKKMQMREKVGKSRNTVFFQWFGAPEGRKVGSLKRRVRSQLARWEMKSCTPLRREAHFEVKMFKTLGFGPLLEVEMWKKCTPLWCEAHFEVKMYNTPFSDHFWKLRCRKSARRCGAKHISKSKCTKHTRSGPLLEVEMLKKRTPLWREAHFQVKMYKAHHVRRCTDHFWRFRCRKSARRCGAKHISKSKCTKHTMYGPLLEAQMSLRFASRHYATLYTPLHYTTVHYTILHSTTLQLQLPNYTATLHHTPPHSTTLNYTTLHHITLHSTTLHYTTLHYLPLHFTTLHPTTLHYTTSTTTTTQLHSTTLHYTKLHYTTQQYTTLHYIPLHSTTLHYTTLHDTEWHCTSDRQVDR